MFYARYARAVTYARDDRIASESALKPALH